MMKNLIFVLLILISINVFVSYDDPLFVKISKDELKKPKDENWEFIKDRVFDGETSYFKRIEGPILITTTVNSKSEDSLLVEKTMDFIGGLLPHKKISYFDDEIGIKFSQLPDDLNGTFHDSIASYEHNELRNSNISFISSLITDGNVPGKQKSETLLQFGDGNSFFHKGFERGYTSNTQNIHFNFQEYLDIKTKERVIKYAFLRSLALIQRDFYHKEESVFSDKEITNPNKNFTEKDKFLIQKLYAPDFLEQFKTYMYDTYPWYYVNSFLNKKTAKTQALIIVFLLGLIIIALSFSFFQNKHYKYKYLEYLFPIFIILISWNHLNALYEVLTFFETSPVISFAGIPFAIIFGVIATSIIWSLEKLIIKPNINFNAQLLFKIIITLIGFNLPFIILWNNNFVFDSSFHYNIFFLWLILSLGRGILIYLNHFSESLVKEKDVELSRLKEANAQSELKLLQSHINPHFLYNALNSIAGLAHINADKTEKMALSLSDLFRYSINKKGQEMSTVNEEVTMVQNYLDIEKIRFGDRLTFSLAIEESLKDEKIPMYILQPLVENAIKHGISKIGGEAKIGLEIKKEAQNLLIIVSDNGPDFPKGLVSGHGLQTVHDLLRLSYGDKAAIQWENTPQKHIVISISKTS